MQKIGLIFIALCTVSCSGLFKQTVGRYYANHVYNGGETSKKDFYTEVPYEIIKEIIFVHISSPNSKQKYIFLFDTGGYTEISNNIINEFDAELKDIQGSSRDINGEKVIQSTYCLSSMNIGELEVTNINVMAVDFPTNEFDGVLGADFMEGKIFSFNPVSKQLIITNNINLIDRGGFYRYRLVKTWDKKYNIKGKFLGKTRKYTLDSGSDGFISFFESQDTTKSIRNEHIKFAVLGSSSLKSQNVKISQYKNVSFNDIIIDTATVSERINGRLSNKRFLGNQILNKGRTIMDFKNNRIYFQKGLHLSKSGVEIPSKDVTLALFNKKIVVNSVNMKLKNKNIDPLDVVLSINGTVITPRTFTFDTLELYCNLPMNHLTLERNGKKIKVNLTKKMLGL